MTTEEFADSLRYNAERYFSPEGGGEATSMVLLDSLEHTEDWSRGRTRGHEDAYWVIQGWADAIEEGR